MIVYILPLMIKKFYAYAKVNKYFENLGT